MTRSGVSVSLPAPVGGLNARDALAGMKSSDAIQLENWFPDGDRLRLRDGYALHATLPAGGEVESLLMWRGVSGSRLLAAAAGSICNVTAQGTGDVLMSGLASSRWQGIQFGGRLIMLNGEDAPLSYDGNTLSAAGFTLAEGHDVGDLIGVLPFKGRLYFVEKGSAIFWYADAGAVTGALTGFDLSQVAQHGGHIAALGSWSTDAGSGLDDFFVAVMESGEILIYQGSYAGSLEDWSLVGSFMASPPIGRRCLAKFGGELVLLTRSGYVPLSSVMDGSDDAISTSAWDRIRRLAQDMAQTYGAGVGWQVLAHQGVGYFNIPVVPGNTYEQHVINTATGAWTKFTGIPARCFCSTGEALYFGGGQGQVFLMGGADDNGESLVAVAKSAYSRLSRQGVKHVTAIRPIVDVQGAVSGSIAVLADYTERPVPAGMHQFRQSASGVEWDTAEWDDASWGDPPTPAGEWVSASGMGRSFAVRLEVRAMAQTLGWHATEILYQPGGLR